MFRKIIRIIKYVFAILFMAGLIFLFVDSYNNVRREEALSKRRHREELESAIAIYEKNNPKKNPYAPRSSTTYTSPKATEPVKKATLTAEEWKRLKKQLEEENAREYDPADYDDPEEFADDAFGVDYDDWDEAEEAWYDY